MWGGGWDGPGPDFKGGELMTDKNEKTVTRIIRNIPEGLYKEIRIMALEKDVFIQDMIVRLLQQGLSTLKARAKYENTRRGKR